MKQQRGKFLNFIIVGLILAGLLSGGLYLARQSTAPTETANQPESTTPAPNQPTTPEKPAPSEESEETTTTESNESNPASRPQPTAQATTTAIPASGPESSLGFLSLGALTYATTRLVASRRARSL